MDIENLKGNSYKSKETASQKEPIEERKKVDKVVNGSVKLKKKSGFAKFAGNFISEDVPDVKTYLIKDVAIPTFKKVITEIVDMILYGRSTKSNRPGSKVSYTSYYNDRDRDRDRIRDAAPTRSVFNYDDIILESRGEAENVLSQMQDLIDTYQMVSVGDLYDLVGITTDNYTVHKYGWMNISTAKVSRVREGYVLDLPKALPLK